MKKTFTNPKLIAIMLFLFMTPICGMAATYPLYLCGGGTATLKPDATIEATLKVGDKVVWQEWVNGAATGTATTLPVATIGTAPTFSVGASATVGEHSWRVFVTAINPVECSGDPSDEFKFFVLPDKTLALSTPTSPTYCEATAAASSVITATPTVASALPTDVTYVYAWTAAKDGAAAADAVSIGTASTTATTGVLTVNTTAVGTYVIAATVKYAVPTGATLKSGDNKDCTTTATAPQTITVSPKPGKPSVTFS
jgi:hypothetical protein